MPPSAKKGDVTMAQHVNTNDGHRSPFWHLHRIQKGTPILVRDEHGDWFVYKVTSTRNAVHGETGDSDELTQHTGDATLNLVTCTGSQVQFAQGESFTEANLIVTAALVTD